MTVLWDVAPCSSTEIGGHFRGVWSLCHQDDDIHPHINRRDNVKFYQPYYFTFPLLYSSADNGRRPTIVIAQAVKLLPDQAVKLHDALVQFSQLAITTLTAASHLRCPGASYPHPQLPLLECCQLPVKTSTTTPTSFPVLSKTCRVYWFFSRSNGILFRAEAGHLLPSGDFISLLFKWLHAPNAGETSLTSLQGSLENIL